MNFKVCYKCGKESKYFVYKGSSPNKGILFYNDTSYWDIKGIRKDGINYYSFVCKDCVLIEILIAKLGGVKFTTLNRIGGGYSLCNIDQWLSQEEFLSK